MDKAQDGTLDQKTEPKPISDDLDLQQSRMKREGMKDELRHNRDAKMAFLAKHKLWTKDSGPL